MKKTNKIISILLVLVMMLTMAPLSLTASAAANDKVFIGNASIIQLKGNAATIEAGSKANFTKIKIGNEYIDFSKYKNSPYGEAMFTLGDSNYEADLSGSEIRGAQYISMTGDVNITMTGGVVQKIIGSCANRDAVLTGNVNITMTGGKVNDIWGAEFGVDGNVNITVTGGTVIDTICIMYRNTTITGDGNVIITGGSSCTIYKVDTLGNIKGSTNLYSTLPPYGYDKDNFTNFVYSDGSNWKFGGNTATALKGNTLTIASGQTATVDSGKTLSGTIVNNGTINVKNGGTLSGTVTNNGTIWGYGNISGVTNSSSGKIIKKVTASGTNVTFNDSAWQNNKTNYDDAYNATLTAASGYALPASVTVKVGGTTLAESAYTYNASTGALSIPSAKITTDTTVSASAPLNLSDSANRFIMLEKAEYTYTGSAITPALWVNGVKANANDYTAEYSDNTNVGTATVTVTGKNSYTGSKVLTFKILPANISEATVTLGDSLTYNGATQTQTVKSVTVNGITLTEGIDYTISGNTAKDAGTYTLTITGINNAVGTITKNWKIAPKSVTTSATVQDKVYDGTTTVDASTVSIIFDGVVDGDDVSAESVNAIFTNANAGNNKTVNVSYKAVGEDVANYNFSDSVTVPENALYFIKAKANILPKDISDAEIVLGDVLIYNGAEQTQTIESVTVDGFDVTYDVSGNTATNVGIYELTITGNGNFTGTKTALFTITPKDISGGEVVLGDALKYNGCEQDMTVESVTVDGMDVTYTASGYIATNVGIYPLTVTGTGNFCGEITVLYEIEVNTSAIDGINTSNVKSTDIATIENFLYQLDNAVTDYADEDKLAEWDELRAYCNELLAKEKEITEEYKRIILAVRSYDESTVKSADKDALIQLDEDIYALALTDNLTEQKIQGLEEAHDKILVLLDKITGISDEIKRIIEEVDKYVFESVKSTDKADIEQLIEDIAVLLATQNITPDERALLEIADETCNKLIAKIDETIAEVERVDNETNAYDIETVTAEDKENIENLLADIGVITDTDNLTADERTQLNGNAETLEALLEKINAVAEEIVRIEDAVNVYDESTVKSPDTEDLNQLKADIKALTDGENITEGERANLTELDGALDVLLKKIADTQVEIERIDEAVNGYDIESVNSADIQALGKLIDDIETLTDGDNITEEEKAALEDNKATIDALIEKLTEVAEEIARVNEAVNGYDESAIKSTDSADLAQFKADIQALIDSTNVTENEQIALGKMIADIEALEEKIAETEAKLEKIQDIENGYTPETVTSDDKAAIEETLAEIESVNPDNLTAEQKAEYAQIKADFEALLAEIEEANAQVDVIGAELEMFDEERVTIFSKDEIEALKAKIDELLADTNMGEAEKAKLNEYMSQAEKLIEIINTPAEYLAVRIFYFIWDALHWLSSHVVFIYNWVLAMI